MVPGVIMQITVTASDGRLYPLDISEDLQVMDLKALLEMETGITTDQMILIFNMTPLDNDEATLRDCNIQEGDVLVVTKVDESDVHVDQRPHRPIQSGSQSDILPTIDWGAVHVPMSGMVKATA